MFYLKKYIISETLLNYNCLKILRLFQPTGFCKTTKYKLPCLSECIKNLQTIQCMCSIIVKPLHYNGLAGRGLCSLHTFPILRFVLLVRIHCPMFLHSSVPFLLLSISLCLVASCAVQFYLRGSLCFHWTHTAATMRANSNHLVTGSTFILVELK